MSNKAFVKTNNKTFPNVNFYLAWEAFNTMGYDVFTFEESDYDFTGAPTYDFHADGTKYSCISSKADLESSYAPNRVHQITTHTPLFAGVTVFRKVIDKLGVNYSPFDCYPEVLNPFYGRNLIRTTLGQVRIEFGKTNTPMFVKPIKPKVFTGVVLASMLNLIPIANISDDEPVYVCEPIKILSEYRVYVNDGQIMGVKHYHGDWSIAPTKENVEGFVKAYKPSPIAYGIDIGVIKDPQTKYYRDIVLEVNDGCNLGNYGLDSIFYGEMIVARWMEIMEQGGKGSELRKGLQVI